MEPGTLTPSQKHTDDILDGMRANEREHYLTQLHSLLRPPAGQPDPSWQQWVKGKTKVTAAYRAWMTARVSSASRPDGTAPGATEQKPVTSPTAETTQPKTQPPAQSRVPQQGGRVARPDAGAWRRLNEHLHSIIGSSKATSKSDFTFSHIKNLPRPQRNDICGQLRHYVSGTPADVIAKDAATFGVTIAELKELALRVIASPGFREEFYTSFPTRMLNMALHSLSGTPNFERNFTEADFKKLVASGNYLAVDKVLRPFCELQAKKKPYLRNLAEQMNITDSELGLAMKTLLAENKALQECVPGAGPGSPTQAEWALNKIVNHFAGIKGHFVFNRTAMAALDHKARTNILNLMLAIKMPSLPQHGVAAIAAKFDATVAELRPAVDSFLPEHPEMQAAVETAIEQALTIGNVVTMAEPAQPGGPAAPQPDIPEQLGTDVKAWHQTWPDLARAVNRAAGHDLAITNLAAPETPQALLELLTHVRIAIDTSYHTVDKAVGALKLSLVDLAAATKGFLSDPRSRGIRQALHGYPPYQKARERKKAEAKSVKQTADPTTPTTAAEPDSSAPPVTWQVTIGNDGVKTWLQGKHLSVGTIAAKLREVRPDGRPGLKKIGDDIYHYRCANPLRDYRIVGRATGTTLRLVAVYSHAKGGGKKHETGERVREYETKS